MITITIPVWLVWVTLVWMVAYFVLGSVLFYYQCKIEVLNRNMIGNMLEIIDLLRKQYSSQGR